MTTKNSAEVEHIEYHANGSVWAKGNKRNGVLTGYWEWFRKDGTKLRSGYFTEGEQVGEWITYDRSGRVYKVSQMKKSARKSSELFTQKAVAKPKSRRTQRQARSIRGGSDAAG